MKKNLILSLVVAGAMGLMLTGCGNKPEKVTVEVEPTTEVTTEITNPEEQPLIDEEPTTEEATDNTVEVEIVEDGTTVSDEQVEVTDYLAENGITITPCGEMPMTLAHLNSDELVDTTVVISIEEVPSEQEGYTDTIFTAKIDAAATNQNYNSTYGIYDRYTGYDLTYTGNDVSFVNESGSYTDVCVVEVDGVKYDCSYTFTTDISDNNTHIVTLTSHHPSDYDGAVFQMGRRTATMEALEKSLDSSVQRKLADYPELIEGHYFFTATDN